MLYEGTMEIRYQNTVVDLFKFNIYHFSKSLIFKILIPASVLLIILPAFQLWQKMKVPLVFILIPIVMNAIVFVVLMSIALTIGLVASYLPKLNKTLLTEHKLIASETGVVILKECQTEEHGEPHHLVSSLR